MLRKIIVMSMFIGWGTALAADDQRTDQLRNAITACTQAGEDRNACRFFTAKMLKEAYGIEEFCPVGQCMTASQIATVIKDKADKWQILGSASDQNTLNQASDLVGQGKVVLATYLENGVGQVGIIIPGNKVKSGRWNLEVPLVAAARVDKPEASLYAKGLNYLFTDPSKVTIYTAK